MNIQQLLNDLEAGCTYRTARGESIFDKELFIVKSALIFSLKSEGIDDEQSTKLKAEFDRHIPKILGVGHSLYSCIQFGDGKKGKAAIEALERQLLGSTLTEMEGASRTYGKGPFTGSNG
ncbi:MAG: hypothetical protein V7707_02520 [Motiliproteus sp.]